MVLILNETARDGVQSRNNEEDARPGGTNRIEALVQHAKNSAEMGIQIFDAGIAEGRGGFEKVNAVAKASAEEKNMVITSFTRAIKASIDTTIKALEPAKRKGVQLLTSPSLRHVEVKFGHRHKGKSATEIQQEIIVPQFVEAIQHAVAKKEAGEIELVHVYIEDASWMWEEEPAYLEELIRTYRDLGVDMISLPDTMGISDPTDYVNMLKMGQRVVREGDPEKRVLITAHCHNDFNQAAGNTILAVTEGVADVIEGTFGGDGPGEGKGNADLNGVLGMLDRKGLVPEIDMELLAKTNESASQFLQRKIPKKAAVVGAEAMRQTHAGIHQAALLRVLKKIEALEAELERATGDKTGLTTELERQRGLLGIYRHDFTKYGVKACPFFSIGEHSGNGGMIGALQERGIDYTDENLEKILNIAAKISEVNGYVLSDEKMETVVWDVENPEEQRPLQVDYDSIDVETHGKEDVDLTMTVTFNGEERQVKGSGKGSVSAFVSAIDTLLPQHIDVTHKYSGQAVFKKETEGEQRRDAEVMVDTWIQVNGDKISTYGFDDNAAYAGYKATELAVNRWLCQFQNHE